ncbi:MAG: hypothetical protein N2515_08845 [Deltaproteobacteria bacterium]|nr:hypothetical protein [Deltaproteobacteria bacterium]
MICRMMEHGDDHVLAEQVFGDGPFITGDSVPALVALELFAQAAALHVSHARSGHGEGTPKGALIGVRQLELFAPCLPTKQRLRIEARQVAAIPPAAQYQCMLWQESKSKPLALGLISVAIGDLPKGT